VAGEKPGEVQDQDGYCNHVEQREQHNFPFLLFIVKPANARSEIR